ncbi:MAG: soluble lytic murein transglycosylase [Kiritimatiellia bacterium]|jgi:soluble lytic murein transglycosylase
MPYAVCKTIAFSLLLVNGALATETYSSADDDLIAKQRILYLEAKDAFKQKHLKRYQGLKKQLSNYPLYPYLEYSELSQQLSHHKANYRTSTRAPKRLEQKVDTFLTSHQQTYLGTRLLRKWLGHLASTKNWRDYKRYYQPHVEKTQLQCLYLHAKIKTGESFPTEAIAAIWLNAQSQPKACDPLFAQWQKKGHMTQEKLWQRFKLAGNASNYHLMTYLQKKMNPSNQYIAKLYKNVHKNPAKIKNVSQLSTLLSKSPASSSTNSASHKINDVIHHGLHRYAYYEPLETLALLKRLKKNHALDKELIYKLQKRISLRLIKKGNIDASIALIKDIAAEHRTEQVEYLLRKFLETQQWPKINYWLEQLSPEQLLTDRWQYWKARSLEELQDTRTGNSTTNNHEDIYNQLSTSRSFYGFLAADKQKTSYQFEDKPAPLDLALIKKVRLTPSFQRAKEFFFLDQMHRARVEWSYGIKNFSADDYLAAGQLAHLWGWNRKAIEAMAGAAYWDDLTIRFPIVHKTIVRDRADTNNIPSSLIFSIARQESAWELDARSRVGARGLMQLMPATAKETAQKANLRYVKRKLFEPEYNITLGSHYLNNLLKQYNNNRALAIASYNAGPTRVKQWLKKTQASLPLDAWIETIPFKETRKYVQNVLSYEVIYSYRQGQKSKILTLAEANSFL